MKKNRKLFIIFVNIKYYDIYCSGARFVALLRSKNESSCNPREIYNNNKSLNSDRARKI